jgi:hypothetical protein
MLANAISGQDTMCKSEQRDWSAHEFTLCNPVLEWEGGFVGLAGSLLALSFPSRSSCNGLDRKSNYNRRVKSCGPLMRVCTEFKGFLLVCRSGRSLLYRASLCCVLPQRNNNSLRLTHYFVTFCRDDTGKKLWALTGRCRTIGITANLPRKCCMCSFLYLGVTTVKRQRELCQSYARHNECAKSFIRCNCSTHANRPVQRACKPEGVV